MWKYIDGTKIESKANKYTFVWRRTVEKIRKRLMKKIKVLLSQIDDVIIQDKAADLETVSLTPSLLTEPACELRSSLEQYEIPTTKEEKSPGDLRNWRYFVTSFRNTTLT